MTTTTASSESESQSPASPGYAPCAPDREWSGRSGVGGVVPEKLNLVDASVEDCCAAFVYFEAKRETSFKAQGRVICALRKKLQPGETVYGKLRGLAPNGSISNAMYAANVFQEVINGSLSDDEYQAMTFREVIAFTAARAPKSAVLRSVREPARTTEIAPSIADGILDTEVPMERRLLSALDNAKAAILAARELIGVERLPRQWDQLLTGALTATTRVVFLAKEEFRERAAR